MPGVEATMREFKRGTLHSGSAKGPKVTSRKQAVAIALSEQRKRGKTVAKKKPLMRKPMSSVSAKNTGGAMKNAPSPVQRELKRKPVPKKKPLMRKSMPSVPAKNTGGAMRNAGKSKVGTAKSKGFAYGRKTV